jgi:hypothetical protein
MSQGPRLLDDSDAAEFRPGTGQNAGPVHGNAVI